jgi:hypothetical protein
MAAPIAFPGESVSDPTAAAISIVETGVAAVSRAELAAVVWPRADSPQVLVQAESGQAEQSDRDHVSPWERDAPLAPAQERQQHQEGCPERTKGEDDGRHVGNRGLDRDDVGAPAEHDQQRGQLGYEADSGARAGAPCPRATIASAAIAGSVGSIIAAAGDLGADTQSPGPAARATDRIVWRLTQTLS